MICLKWEISRPKRGRLFPFRHVSVSPPAIIRLNYVVKLPQIGNTEPEQKLVFSLPSKQKHNNCYLVNKELSHIFIYTTENKLLQNWGNKELLGKSSLYNSFNLNNLIIHFNLQKIPLWNTLDRLGVTCVGFGMVWFCRF